MEKKTTKQIIELLPPNYQLIAEKTFILPETNHRLFIRVRTKNLDTKPALYLFDTDNNFFVSSLYYNPETKRFIFDYTVNDIHYFSSIDTAFNVYPETAGYYKFDKTIMGRIMGAGI